jgi:hypothetical protein
VSSLGYAGFDYVLHFSVFGGWKFKIKKKVMVVQGMSGRWL